MNPPVGVGFNAPGRLILDNKRFTVKDAADNTRDASGGKIENVGVQNALIHEGH